ncbi:MAG: FAD-dependent oxidoreductase [Thermoleophilia bacterium]|nr:FAD-dependent oxidoreductase [Thermoleophilia bacterium]
MAERHVDHLLIGGGLASGNCARWLREAGGEGEILLIGREPEPPYNRPALSKGYLAATERREMDYFRPKAFWSEQRIELMTKTSVTKLDAENKVATLMNKQEISFDSALVATGANVRLLHVDGMGQDGIHYLRAYGNADSLREDLDRLGRRVTCIGGSYIGCEVAATLSRLDCDCRIVMLEDLPLQNTLGEDVGEWTRDHLESLGITIHAGESLARFEGDGERVTKAVMESGLEIDTDVVVIGVGVHPDTMLARAAGLTIGERGGILCDSHLRTSAPDIFAAGDVCEYESAIHGGPIRIEHWDVALNHGKTVALNMLGQPTEHVVVPYFWTELAGTEIESVGTASSWQRVIVRGQPKEGPFSAWYIDGDRVVQVAAVGRPDDIETGRELIGARSRLAPDAIERIADTAHAVTAPR